jgi:hypothetical protein
VDGYHLGLWVTIALLAAGVAVSYLTLRPRTAALSNPAQAATHVSPAVTTPPPGPAGAARESVAVAELTTVDELAADLLAPGEMTR